MFGSELIFHHIYSNYEYILPNTTWQLSFERLWGICSRSPEIELTNASAPCWCTITKGAIKNLFVVGYSGTPPFRWWCNLYYSVHRMGCLIPRRQRVSQKEWEKRGLVRRTQTRPILFDQRESASVILGTFSRDDDNANKNGALE